jgi:hypothetical protein
MEGTGETAVLGLNLNTNTANQGVDLLLGLGTTILYEAPQQQQSFRTPSVLLASVRTPIR